MIATDTEGNVRFLNSVAQELTAWKEHEAEGQPLGSVFKIVNEQTRKTVENPALRALKEGVIVGLANHTILIARDGTERPIDDSAAPIRDADGKTVGAVLVFRDITARKKAEEGLAERVRLMAMSAEVGAALTQGRHVEARPAALCRGSGRIPGRGVCPHLDPRPGGGRAGTASQRRAVHAHRRAPWACAGRQAQDRPDRPGAEGPPDQCCCRRPSCSGTGVGQAEGLVAFAGYPLTVEDRLVGVMAMFARARLDLTTP